MAGIRGMKNYPLEMKIVAVKMYFEEGLSCPMIMERLGVKNDTQLEGWFRAYRQNGFEGLASKTKGRPRKTPKPEVTLDERIKQLEMENELLRSFLSEIERWSIKR